MLTDTFLSKVFFYRFTNRWHLALAVSLVLSLTPRTKERELAGRAASVLLSWTQCAAVRAQLGPI